MTQPVFQFGQRIPGFEIPVLNERAVRAGAGILFFFAIIAFMNAWLTGNFQPTRVFVVGFLVDFTIRIFVNPRFAPSLIVGGWFVRNQQPEYTGAPQKRFAWAIGFVLAALMAYLVVLNNVVGPVNLIVCSICLLLLFFETAFGICLGCKIYNLFNRDQAQLCPGGVCEVDAPRGDRIGAMQALIVVAFVALVGATAQWVAARGVTTPRAAPAVAGASQGAGIDPAEAARCKVPDFAKAIGHEEKWKLHNNCK